MDWSQNTDSDFCWESIASGFSQAELNDLIRNLYLSKESKEPRLKEMKMKCGTFFVLFFNRRRYADFVTFIHERYNNVFVTVSSLLGDITDNWRLFIGSSKRNLKCVLLHNTNRYAISLAHSIVVKKHYDGIKRVLQKWNIMI